jgi:hypothetical protein
MSVNSIGQRTSSLKPYDHVGNQLPVAEHSDSMYPSADLRVASWLPVEYYDRHSEDWFAILPGKGVAADNYGHIVPAGLGVSGATVTYTTNDVANKTINVTTGSVVTSDELTGGSVSYAVSGVTTFMGGSSSLAISSFIGYAPYPMMASNGDASSLDDNYSPLGNKYQNYDPQPNVMVGCDYVLALPVVPAATSAESLTFNAPSSNVSASDAVSNLPVAKNTVRTPFTFTDSGSGDSSLFVNEVSSASAIAGSGDYHVDLTTGIVSVYASSAPTGVSLAYYNYASAPTGSSVSSFACVLGDIDAGDFLKFNVDSNYIKATPATDGLDVICAQVVAIQSFPGQTGLDKVLTGWDNLNTSATGALPGYDGQLDQSPGTATGGVPAKVHYAGGADKVAIINFINR